MLKVVRDAERAGRPVMPMERAVWRLTGEIGELARRRRRARCAWAIAPTSVVIDPAALDERLDAYHEAPMENLGGLQRMVNRSDGAVRAVARRRARRLRGRRVRPGARAHARLRLLPAGGDAAADAGGARSVDAGGAARGDHSQAARRGDRGAHRGRLRRGERAARCARAPACRRAGCSATSRRARR